MPNLSAIIVDDEDKARENLLLLLSNYCPEVTVLASCCDIETAQSALQKHQPDLVFLDINMPGGSGFDLITSIKNRSFEVVFITAYNEFAVKAFEQHAIGYILKPIHSKMLTEAVKRASLVHQGSKSAVDDLVSDLQNDSIQGLVPLPVDNGLELVSLDQIIRFQADGSYAHVFLSDGRKMLLVKNLKNLEQLVSSRQFFRIHNSHLVNLKHVRRVVKTDGGFVVMSDGKELEISRRKKAELYAFLSN